MKNSKQIPIELKNWTPLARELTGDLVIAGYDKENHLVISDKITQFSKNKNGYLGIFTNTNNYRLLGQPSQIEFSDNQAEQFVKLTDHDFKNFVEFYNQNCSGMGEIINYFVDLIEADVEHRNDNNSKIDQSVVSKSRAQISDVLEKSKLKDQENKELETIKNIIQINRWLPFMRVMDRRIVVIGQDNTNTVNPDLPPVQIVTSEIDGIDRSIIQDVKDELYQLIGPPVYIPQYKQDTRTYFAVNEDDYKEFLNIWDPSSTQDCFDSFCDIMDNRIRLQMELADKTPHMNKEIKEKLHRRIPNQDQTPLMSKSAPKITDYSEEVQLDSTIKQRVSKTQLSKSVLGAPHHDRMMHFEKTANLTSTCNDFGVSTQIPPTTFQDTRFFSSQLINSQNPAPPATFQDRTTTQSKQSHIFPFQQQQQKLNFNDIEAPINQAVYQSDKQPNCNKNNNTNQAPRQETLDNTLNRNVVNWLNEQRPVQEFAEYSTIFGVL